MATQTLSPSTTVDDATIGTVAWVNPNNIQASDNVYATVALLSPDSTHYLKATNFGFSIPAGATINGLLAEVEGMNNTASSYYGYGHAVKSGVIQTPQFQINLINPTEGFTPFGSSSDLWGQTWTPADINASNFGFALERPTTNTVVSFSIDYIRITVDYTPLPPATLTGISQLTGVGSLTL